MDESNIDAMTGAMEAIYRGILGPKANLYDFEPKTVNSQTGLYFIFTDLQMPDDDADGNMTFKWTVKARLLLAWTDNETVERRVRSLLPKIIKTFGHNITLNGTIADGQALITGAIGRYITIGGKPFRLVEVTHVIVEHLAFTYAP